MRVEKDLKGGLGDFFLEFLGSSDGLLGRVLDVCLSVFFFFEPKVSDDLLLTAALGLVRYQSGRSIFEQVAQGEVDVYTTQICLPNSQAVKDELFAGFSDPQRGSPKLEVFPSLALLALHLHVTVKELEAIMRSKSH